LRPDFLEARRPRSIAFLENLAKADSVPEPGSAGIAVWNEFPAQLKGPLELPISGR
jgi:hypothetical protein